MSLARLDELRTRARRSGGLTGDDAAALYALLDAAVARRAELARRVAAAGGQWFVLIDLQADAISELRSRIYHRSWRPWYQRFELRASATTDGFDDVDDALCLCALIQMEYDEIANLKLRIDGAQAEPTDRRAVEHVYLTLLDTKVELEEELARLDLARGT